MMHRTLIATTVMGLIMVGPAFADLVKATAIDGETSGNYQNCSDWSNPPSDPANCDPAVATPHACTDKNGADQCMTCSTDNPVVKGKGPGHWGSSGTLPKDCGKVKKKIIDPIDADAELQ